MTTGKKNAGARASRPHREWHSRGYLPHLDHAGLVQSITFRLADSMPEAVLSKWRSELGLTNATRNVRPPENGQADTQALQSVIEYHHRIEEYLDHGHGACHLRDPRIAELVENALLHFDGKRYRMLSWVIMPNHVHALIETLPGHRLEDILHSWKSFTAKQANQQLGRAGRFWQEEYFDRFIRDRKHLQDAIRYIENNPVKAKLASNAADWRFSSAAQGNARNASRRDAGIAGGTQEKGEMRAGRVGTEEMRAGRPRSGHFR